MEPPAVSVVIPAYKEGELLRQLLASLEKMDDVETIVSIAASDEMSKNSVSWFNVKIVEGERGRGNQLAAGANMAKGEILFFCHADTRLPSGWKEEICSALDDPAVACGAFRLRFDPSGFFLRAVAFAANIRSSLFSLPYGDQGLFLKRERYFAIGAYRPIALMEDVDIVRRLSRIGRVYISSSSVATSPRRYAGRPGLCRVMKNAIILALYFCGVSPEKLSRIY